MRHVENGLLSEIRNKLGYLDRHLSPEMILKERKIFQSKILKSAQYQSFKIEHPNLGTSYSIPRNDKKNSIRIGIQNIESALKWGKNYFQMNGLDENLLRGISGRILPDIYPGNTAFFRSSGTRIVGARTTPPDPYKIREVEIPLFLDSLNRKLKDPDKIAQMMAAFYAHLHLVRIHPFVDGNGRTSRALQDIILDHNIIPLPIIDAGERYTYFDALDEAVYDWKHLRHSGEITHGSTAGEKNFYTFMAGKVNSSLDKVICLMGKGSSEF
ncbi:MAG: Fic family protein [Nanoarchaeota archaeon]|nr:Fic family protein [Nanoarchaeota archaeon]